VQLNTSFSGSAWSCLALAERAQHDAAARRSGTPPSSPAGRSTARRNRVSIWRTCSKPVNGCSPRPSARPLGQQLAERAALAEQAVLAGTQRWPGNSCAASARRSAGRP
jgi:hypothetical protein